MTNTAEQRKLPPPWRVVEHGECFMVEDANGVPLAFVYFEDDSDRRKLMNRLTSDEARRVAATFARLPKLLGQEKRIAAVRADLESRADALMEWPEGSEAATLELIANVIDAIDGPDKG